MKKYIGALMLLLAAIIWGFAFVAQSVGMDYVGPFTFNFSRYLIGAAVLAPFALYNAVKKKTVTKENRRITIFGGIGCGVILFVASSLQQIGIKYTTAVGKAGFLTALYIIFVPIVGILFKKKCRAIIWISVLVSVAGLYLLCVKEGFSFEFADIILIGCAIGFTFHIIFIDYVSPKTDGVVISCIQFAVASLICLPVSAINEKLVFSNILGAWLPILYAGVMSCGIAYTFQILGQKRVPPAEASLIMCLESVFSAIGGWIILHEILSLREIIGCVVVFVAIILAQFAETKTEKKVEE